jgi:hypothetical protein
MLGKYGLAEGLTLNKLNSRKPTQQMLCSKAEAANT